MKKLIICLLGATGAGKSTILDILVNDKSLNLHRLVYHTTRKPREGEIDGVDYNFIEENVYYDHKYTGDIIEKRKYDTVYGPLYYYTTVKDIHANEDGPVIAAVSVDQYNAYKKYAIENNIEVIGIMIDVSTKTRINRLISRAESEDDCYEICRRVLEEKEELSRLDRSKIYSVVNDVCDNQESSALFVANDIKETIIKPALSRLQ